MLDRITQSALYNAAEAGYEQAARADIAKVDPMLRPAVNKRVRGAINAAIDRTGPVDDVVDEQHQLFVAYLLLTNALADIEPRDRDAVSAAFEKAGKTAPKTFSGMRYITPLVLLLVLGGGALVGYQLFGPSPEQRVRRSALGRAVGDELTNWVVTLDKYRRSRDALRATDQKLKKLNERREKLLASTKEAAGDPGVKALTEVLEQAERLEGSGRPKEAADAKAKPDPKFVPEDEKSLSAAAKAFNDILAAKGEPVVLDTRTHASQIRTSGDLGGLAAFREVIIVSYFVERRGKFTYGDKSTDITLGKRLDSLNVGVAVDAYDTAALGGVLVSLDLAEAHLTESLMTPLAGTTPWELMPAKEAEQMEGGKEMLDRAGAVLREELLDSVGVERDVATKIADLLARRSDAVKKLTDMKIRMPRKLLLDNETVEKLEHFRGDNLDAYQVLELNEKLEHHESDFSAILLEFADAATVRGVVYLLEADHTFVPTDLKAALDDLPEGYRDPEHPRRQMLADLAAIAQSDKLARTLLSLVVSRMLQSSPRFVSPAPRATLTAIAAQLGVEPADPWVERGRITKRFPAFYLALMGKSSAEIQQAAASVLEEAAEGRKTTLTWQP